MKTKTRHALLLAALVCGAGWSGARAGKTEASPVLDVKSAVCEALPAGTRIQVVFVPESTPAGNDGGATTIELTGTLLACRGGVLICRSAARGEDIVQVPLAAVASISRSRGRTNHAPLGGAIGLVVGLMVAFASQSGSTHDEEFLAGLHVIDDKIFRGVAITVGGAVAGYLIGTAAGSEDWAKVYAEPRAVGFSGSGDGDVRLAAGFRF